VPGDAPGRVHERGDLTALPVSSSKKAPSSGDERYAGTFIPSRTLLVADFVGHIFLPRHTEEQLYASARKNYRDVWNEDVKNTLDNLRLHQFRTVHGQRMLSAVARDTNLGRDSLKGMKLESPGNELMGRHNRVSNGQVVLRYSGIDEVIRLKYGFDFRNHR
jgi:hypothetical protein